MIIEYPLDNSTTEFGTDQMANLEDTVCINITCICTKTYGMWFNLFPKCRSSHFVYTKILH